jgi:hypothetical protein
MSGRQPHLQMLELFALLRSQELLDLGVSGVDLLTHLRAYVAHDRIDARSVAVQDALNLCLLL